MRTITNKSDISLALAVWLVHDEYDYVEGVENYISATTLLRPLRQIVLAPRIKDSPKSLDVENLIASALGKAIHDSIEKAWKTGHVKALKTLGIPDAAIEQIRVNPTEEEVRASNSIIPIYLEQRAFRKHGKFTIGGKFDLVTDGMVQDAKSTSAFTWLYNTNTENYRLQMSVYRWIDAGQSHRKITEDIGKINFIFTDWQRSSAKSNPDYPQSKLQSKDIDLMSIPMTERWIDQKLKLIEKYIDAPESEIPECTDEELWRSAPKYKYYSDPSKTAGKSTKNFDNLQDANAHKASKGGTGVVIAVPGSPKRCDHCPVFPICTQKDRYLT